MFKYCGAVAVVLLVDVDNILVDAMEFGELFVLGGPMIPLRAAWAAAMAGEAVVAVSLPGNLGAIVANGEDGTDVVFVDIPERGRPVGPMRGSSWASCSSCFRD